MQVGVERSDAYRLRRQQGHHRHHHMSVTIYNLNALTNVFVPIDLLLLNLFEGNFSKPVQPH